VNALLANIIGNIRHELHLADLLHQSIYGAAAAVSAVARFDEWANYHFEHMALQVKKWADLHIDKALAVWRATPNHPGYTQAISAIGMLSALVGGITVNLSNVPGQAAG
jgi:hypothetical protein